MNKEDLQRYLIKSGDEVSDMVGNLVENEHGFCIWKLSDDALILVCVYGDGEYWDTWAESKAKSLNVNKIIFGTKRSPKAYCKKYGYHLAGYILERDI